MKTIFIRKTLFALLTGAFLATAAVSCSKDDNTNGDTDTYNTTGNASGSQQNPAVTTTGTGSLTGTYDARTNNWQYTINWTTLTSTATAVQLFGPANAGVNGNMLLALTITTPGINGSASGSVTLTEQQEAWLLAGQLYYSVITAANITGEIRGQITASAN
jgi:hypothetical protein